jgi:hypothetical protein
MTVDQENFLEKNGFKVCFSIKLFIFVQDIFLIGKGVHSVVFSCFRENCYDEKNVCVKVTSRKEFDDFIKEFKIGRFFRKFESFATLIFFSYFK